VRLHDKRGKQHAMPCRQALAEILRAYIDAAGIADYRKSWLFRACRGHNPMILCQGEPLWTATSSIQIWMTPL
jgi:hypothetical protein